MLGRRKTHSSLRLKFDKCYSYDVTILCGDDYEVILISIFHERTSLWGSWETFDDAKLMEKDGSLMEDLKRQLPK